MRLSELQKDVYIIRRTDRSVFEGLAFAKSKKNQLLFIVTGDEEADIIEKIVVNDVPMDLSDENIKDLISNYKSIKQEEDNEYKESLIEKGKKLITPEKQEEWNTFVKSNEISVVEFVYDTLSDMQKGLNPLGNHDEEDKSLIEKSSTYIYNFKKYIRNSAAASNIGQQIRINKYIRFIENDIIGINVELDTAEEGRKEELLEELRLKKSKKEELKDLAKEYNFLLIQNKYDDEKKFKKEDEEFKKKKEEESKKNIIPYNNSDEQHDENKEIKDRMDERNDFYKNIYDKINEEQKESKEKEREELIRELSSLRQDAELSFTEEVVEGKTNDEIRNMIKKIKGDQDPDMYAGLHI